ncbi:hypothetical protein N7539_006640 [Penicillium diatomitis]|uniref:Helix-turn-helix domain-containing protein n=1 Tax=Penicillium diatomitis TaxID=2819901 RepID=A0A9W9X1L9_9EURO|nr:uncharacterized protein N7539_006640 [Penicillium diatomitis]KAJ5480746.1 hypothetical protein N7539_006640 [Penicillium diatomitis]
MGSAASKPAKSAAGAAARRQYPKQAPVPPRVPSTAAKTSQATQAPSPPTPEFAPRSQSQAPPSGPKYHSEEQPSSHKTSGISWTSLTITRVTKHHTDFCATALAIDLDGRDPHFAASLRNLGPVTPSPTLSNSSTVNRGPMQSVFPSASNPALLALAARQRVAEAAQKEFDELAHGSQAGRQFLDAFTISQALTMRDQQKMAKRDIERSLRMKEGVMDQLGKDGLVSRVSL